MPDVTARGGCAGRTVVRASLYVTSSYPAPDAESVKKATTYLTAKATAGLVIPSATPAPTPGGLSAEALSALAGLADVNDPAIAAALAQLAAKK